MKSELNWSSLCKAWESSGLSQKQFCTENALSYGKFCEQRSLLINRGEAKSQRSARLQSKQPVQPLMRPSFLPLEFGVTSPAAPQKQLEIQLPHGIILRIPLDVAV